MYAFEGDPIKAKHTECFFVNLGFRPELYTPELSELYGRSTPDRRVDPSDLPFNSGQGTPSAIFNLDLERMAAKDSYTFPGGVIASSPLVMRSPESPRRYLVVVVHTSPRDQIWLFDADDLAGGPLAKLTHPDLRLGFTLHTAFLPGFEPCGEAYKVDVAEEASRAIASLRAPQAEKDALSAAIVTPLRRRFGTAN